MRALRPWLLFSLTLLFPVAAHASLLAKLYFLLRTSMAPAPVQKAKLAGQETRAFKLRKAPAEDVLVPLQSYLNGISKVGGSIQLRAADNALVATDYPENLARLAALIPDIDQVYANENAQARQMLITQSLMKAIRNHPDGTVTSHGGDRAAPLRVNNGAPNVPFSVYGHSHDADDMSPAPSRRWTHNPTLQQFEVVGWMQDDQGYTIVLTNQGQRFLYRHGKLHGGYSPGSKPLEGIDGTVRDNQLILNEGANHVSLKMLKWRTL